MAKVEIIKRPIEKISGNIKMMAWSAVIESLALLILGILLIAWPDMMITIITYIVGAFFIVKGAYQIINYFIERGQKDFFNNDLLFGVISVLAGIAALAIGEQIVNVFRVVIGIWIIYESLVRINTSVKLAAAKIANWKYVLLVALIMMVLGVFVAFNGNADAYLIGWMMILTGVVGIVGGIMFIQHVNTIVENITKN